MEKKVLVVKNISREGPGLIEEALDEVNFPYQIIDLSTEEFPEVRDCAALIVLGGPDSANDDTSRMRTELARIQEVLALGIPYLGICLGLQTLIKVIGGSVVMNAVREIGFRDSNHELFTVELTEEGKRDLLFNDMGDRFKVFQLHGETVETTAEVKLLATGKFCTNQILRVGTNAYGIQSHFELTPEMFTIWLAEDTDLQKLDKEMVRADFDAVYEEYKITGLQLLRNFFAIVQNQT